MKRRRLLGVLMIVTLSLALQSPLTAQTDPHPETYSGGDGTTVQTAVVIDAKDDISATRAEYAWLREHVPGAKKNLQSLIHDEDHVYDVIEVILPDGTTKRSYFFDITRTFGKL